MFVAFDLGTRVVNINLDNVSDIICDYIENSSEQRYEMKIFPVDGNVEPWVWTFKDKDSLNQACSDIFYGKEKYVYIKEGLA